MEPPLATVAPLLLRVPPTGRGSDPRMYLPHGQPETPGSGSPPARRGVPSPGHALRSFPLPTVIGSTAPWFPARPSPTRESRIARRGAAAKAAAGREPAAAARVSGPFSYLDLDPGRPSLRLLPNRHMVTEYDWVRPIACGRAASPGASARGRSSARVGSVAGPGRAPAGVAELIYSGARPASRLIRLSTPARNTSTQQRAQRPCLPAPPVSAVPFSARAGGLCSLPAAASLSLVRRPWLPTRARSRRPTAARRRRPRPPTPVRLSSPLQSLISRSVRSLSEILSPVDHARRRGWLREAILPNASGTDRVASISGQGQGFTPSMAAGSSGTGRPRPS
ncbi:hypothetical protein GQ55_1G249500 [Panicum hallii var. hallii]|uniref:Uncharacterized protein n=1 Tax=Panicum hallii var. hallii TaxID=1504633 RepID=A0A2T7F783_9POAL|nr:hypothetical protein GQ55_1G249500 [Panicum hallii var. hallii]